MADDQPTASRTNSIATVDQIHILMKEYDTLRAEIIARMSGGFTLMGVAAALIAWLLSGNGPTTTWPWIVGLIIFLAYTSFFNWAHIALISSRIKRIEMQVNGLAATRLLVWESIIGGTNPGFYERLINASTPTWFKRFFHLGSSRPAAVADLLAERE